jgi:hypothetical protein
MLCVIGVSFFALLIALFIVYAIKTCGGTVQKPRLSMLDVWVTSFEKWLNRSEEFFVPGCDDS